ncbi:MAG: EAL domain-containing protein [Hyphomicrobiales bacterium]|nr:EAL domain-containing protein [Hyphomicrobiales bacterium]
MMITETRVVRQLVEALKATGVTVSLDDFGTGYSSLPVCATSALTSSRSTAPSCRRPPRGGLPMAIAQTMVQLARNLDMTNLAEGIETDEQAQMLMAMGCRRGQGWLFGRPVAEREFTRLSLPARRRALAG